MNVVLILAVLNSNNSPWVDPSLCPNLHENFTGLNVTVSDYKISPNALSLSELYYLSLLTSNLIVTGLFSGI